MKIAICISGHTRTMSTINIINELSNFGIDYDIFISSWNTSGKWLEPTVLPYNQKIPIDKPRLGIYEHDRTPIDTNIFSNIAKVKKCEVEDDTILLPEIINLSNVYKDIIEPGDFDMDREPQRKYQIFSMFRKCQKSIDLIDGEYDLVLRTRFDCSFNLHKVLQQIDTIIGNNIILLPSNFEFGGDNAPGGGRICDSFALGTPDTMKLYGKIYDFLLEAETPQFLKDNDIWFCPHSLLRQHLLKNNIKYIKENIDYDIVRGEKIFTDIGIKSSM